MLRILAALAVFALAPALVWADAPSPAMALPPQPKVRPAGIPADAVMVSPCVAQMGEHWANLKDLPFGPIYGVYDGKPVFSEIMISKTTMEKGFSYENLRPLPGYSIDHVDITYLPKGHEGFPIPHYDIHAYYVPHDVHMKYCPGSGVR